MRLGRLQIILDPRGSSFRERLALRIAPWLSSSREDAERRDACDILARVAYGGSDVVWTSGRVLAETALRKKGEGI